MSNVDIAYPVIQIYGKQISTILTEDELLTRWTGGSKIIDDTGMKIIDLNGNIFSVENTEILHSVGPFWGYNIFLNRRVRVKYTYKSDVKTISFEEMQKMTKVILKQFVDTPSDAVRLLYQAFNKSKTIADIIRAYAFWEHTTVLTGEPPP